MNIAVTGANGFIGRHLVPVLKAHNDVVVQQLDITQGVDICDWDEVKKIKSDLFIHLANKSYVPDSYERPKEFFDVNLKGTLNILEQARLIGARVIYFSSYVYGNPEYLPIDEKHPIRAFNPYSATKIMCEQMCQCYANELKVPITIVRPFNIYGTGQNKQFLLPMMIHQLPLGKIQVRDDRPKRDFIHIDDVVSAIQCITFAKWTEDFNIYNLGSGKSTSVREIAEILRGLWPNHVEYIATGEIRPNEVMNTIADISKIRKLGWEPKVTLREGLKEMISNLL